MSVVGCAVVGAGGWGSLVADQITATDGLELIGIADNAAQRVTAQAAQRRCRGYSQVSDAWADPDVGAVVVATPSHLHAQLARAALRAGRHVLLEKPMALTTADADSINAAAQQASRVLMLDHIQRYYAPLVALHDLVSRGELGEVQGISVSRRDRLVRTKAWLRDRETVGGLLYQSACHEYDLLRWIGGEICEISCLAAPRVIAPEPLNYPDLIVSQLRFQSGALGQVWDCMTDPLIGYDGVVTGSEGTAWFDLYQAGLRWRRIAGEPQERSWQPADRWSPLAWMSSGGIAEGEAEAMRALLRDFRDAIVTGTPPAVSGLDGARTVELAQAGYLSIADRRPVSLPLSGADRARQTYLEVPAGRDD
ncbi:MAG TPA: Gfo/Idh/MocA family oxidoreductase [Streptosporangiaceae bacterium]